MSHYLNLASHSFPFQPPSLTIFAPADAAFPYAGADQMPSPNLLPFHFHLRSLRSLPFGAKISTLLHGYSLTVTTGADGLSLNGVAVTATPVFDDGSLIIYGTNPFFDPYFRVSGPTPTYGRRDRCCLEPPRNPKLTSSEETAVIYLFSEASKALRSRGCSVMASFLEMQLHGVLTKLTVFAHVDRAMAIGDASEYASISRRHVSPCRICWNDLASLDDDEGALLRTKLQGFTINVSRHGDILTLNGGATVIIPEIYRDNWLVVHGISKVLEFLPEKSPPEEAAASHDHPSPSPLVEFDSDDMEEFEASGGQSEMFVNMTEDDEDVSHRCFFVYSPA